MCGREEGGGEGRKEKEGGGRKGEEGREKGRKEGREEKVGRKRVIVEKARSVLTQLCLAAMHTWLTLHSVLWRVPCRMFVLWSDPVGCL